MDKTTKEILVLFGEYDEVMKGITVEIGNGSTGDTFDRVVYREDFEEDEISEEMEVYFEGKDEFEISVSWTFEIE